jgi:hypothetical protein
MGTGANSGYGNATHNACGKSITEDDLWIYPSVASAGAVGGYYNGYPNTNDPDSTTVPDSGTIAGPGIFFMLLECGSAAADRARKAVYLPEGTYAYTFSGEKICVGDDYCVEITLSALKCGSQWSRLAYFKKFPL